MPDPISPTPPDEKTSTVITSQTSTVTKSDDPAKLAGESAILGVSIRAWLTTLIVGTVCYLSIVGKEVFEPLYGGFMLTIGFFFGQATQKKP